MSYLENRTVERKSFINELLTRRVFQIIGFYIAAGWGIIQFTDWVVNRYLLSPYLTDLALVLLLSLIPSSIIIAYFHGRPGPDKWRRTELIGIPLNLLISFLLIFTLFSGKDLGKVSENVTLHDESGQKIQRDIPKIGFRKRLMHYFFDNISGDQELDWMQAGISFMVEYELSQDLYFTLSSPFSQGLDGTDFCVMKKIQQVGNTTALKMPLLLKKKNRNRTSHGLFLRRNHK